MYSNTNFYFVSYSMICVLRFMFNVLCSMFYILCSMFYVLCSMFHVLCSMFHVLCSIFHESKISVKICNHQHLNMAGKKIVIIGAGFGGLSAAILLAKEGFKVTVLEKNNQPGGRAGQFSENGFTFDTGPSWYMMHHAFEDFFKLAGKDYRDYYEIERLDPTYRAFFDGEQFDISADIDKVYTLFESIEKGSSQRLKKILNESEYLYKKAIPFLQKPFLTPFDFLELEFAFQFIKKRLFRSYENYINSNFKDKRLQDLLSWHTVFLGGTPASVPALYILMLYADLKLGTFYPKGGMHQVVQALYRLAKEYGVTFEFESPVEKINVIKGRAKEVITPNKTYLTDIILSNADYHHTEQQLLEEEWRNYPKSYWDKVTMSPSTFLIFLGLDKNLDNLLHHNYYFSNDSSSHFKSIQGEKEWPSNPSYYISVPSKSNNKISPEGGENIMLLVPVAAGLEDSEVIRERMGKNVLNHFENLIGTSIKDSIKVQKTFAHNDYLHGYNAYKGNAFGLANTLFQTGSFRPRIRSRKVKNLYFAGTTTVPGIGMPLAVISAQVTSKQILKDYGK